jgi:nucleotide-binding universal stress UspA family protein
LRIERDAMNIRNILVPIEFTDISQHAVDHAIAIAQWYSARIVALHAQMPAYAEMPVPVASGDSDDYERDRRAATMDVTAAAVASAHRAGVAATAEIVEGAAAEAITQYAEHAPVDLIVIGTHGYSGLKHLMLGSVTEKVLRHASCPVLTVPPRAQATSTLPFRRILWPTDFSGPSVASLPFALSFAREADAALTLLHVIDEPDEHELFVARSYDVHRHAAEGDRFTGESLIGLVPDGIRDSVRPMVLVRHGVPVEQILRAAADQDADLIVMGVQDRKPLDLMVAGSTTNRIVRRATCPVLTIRA